MMRVFIFLFRNLPRKAKSRHRRRRRVQGETLRV